MFHEVPPKSGSEAGYSRELVPLSGAGPTLFKASLVR